MTALRACAAVVAVLNAWVALEVAGGLLSARDPLPWPLLAGAAVFVLSAVVGGWTAWDVFSRVGAGPAGSEAGAAPWPWGWRPGRGGAPGGGAAPGGPASGRAADSTTDPDARDRTAGARSGRRSCGCPRG